MQRKKATIYDVAAAAGVSATTVSDVLNERDRVALETVEHVKEIIRVVGYQPRRNRRRQHNLGAVERPGVRQLAFLVPDPNPVAGHTPLMEQTAGGMREQLGHDIDLLVVATRGAGALPLCIADGVVDGVMVRLGTLPESSLQTLASIPTVWIYGAPDGRFDMVAPDDEAIGRVACEHLRRRGCGRVLALNPDDLHPAFCVRAACFRLAARQAGLEVQSMACKVGEGLSEQLAAVRSADADGIFVPGFNRHNLPGDVHAAFAAAGVRAVTAGNLIGQGEDNVGFPVISACPAKLGQTAVEQLLWRIANPLAAPRRVLLEPALINEWDASTRIGEIVQ
jgi:DNA-binding LacI/PurR family transcriptional regulator